MIKLFGVITACVFIALIYLVVKSNLSSHQINLTAIHGKVSIQLDEYKIPHIIAESHDNDAFFALGYMHAHDRLWQMEFQRRVASGTLSEVFGDATLKQDKYLRTWGFYLAAKSAWEALDDHTKQLIHAYTLGINHYLSTQSLPLQFYLLRHKPKPWTDIDSIAWQKMMAWNLDTSWDRKVKNYLLAKETHTNAINIFYPPYPEKSPTILSDRDLKEVNLFKPYNAKPDTGLTDTESSIPALQHSLSLHHAIRNELGFTDQAGKGSNAWVVSGKLTQSGKPVLANDVHLPLSAPSLWYLAELRGPALHVTGATIPGLPLIAIGHNDNIAWGVTHSYVDTQDLYIEDKNTKFDIRKEIIFVKNAPPVQLDVKTSQHGPVISSVTSAGKINQLVSIKWPALQSGDTTVTSFAKINYAKDWNEFVTALTYYVTPPQNFIYADTKGNIGYYLAGKIPVRSSWDGKLPIPSNQHHEWEGYIPFDMLPHIYNPPEGFIATANNKIVSDIYPYSLTFRWNVPPYRIERIIEKITESQVNIENTKQLQNDVKSNLWLALRSTLLDTKPLDQASKEALDILRLWDGNVDINSQAASIFAYWYQYFLNPSYSDNNPLTFDPIFVKQQFKNNRCYVNFTTIIDCQLYLSQSLQSAIRKLNRDYGSDATHWKWGNIHQLKYQELAIGKSKALGWIWNRNTPSPGGDFTVNVGTYDPDTMNQTIGAAYRQIIDLSNFNNSLYVIPLGQVDDPFNASYNDQLPLWLSGKYVAMTFSR